MMSQIKYRPSLSEEEMQDCLYALQSTNPTSSAINTFTLFLTKLKLGLASPTNYSKHMNVRVADGLNAKVSATPSWLNDYIDSTDPVIKQAYKQAFNIYLTTEKYPPSLDPFIAEIKEEQNNVSIMLSRNKPIDVTDL